MMSYPLQYPAHADSRPSFLSIARQIHVTHGPAGFYRGLGPTLLRSFPVNACAIFVYEGLMRAMGAEKVLANGINIAVTHSNLSTDTAISIYYI